MRIHPHQDGTERVGTGRSSAGIAPAAVAPGTSAAPITVDASIMFPPVDGDDPLTDDHGLLRIDIPDGLVRAA